MTNLLPLLPPAFIMIFGSILLPFTKSYARMAVAILVTLATLLQVLNLGIIPAEGGLTINIGQFALLPMRIHPYTLIFSLAFVLVAFAASMFSALHSRASELTAAFIYSGSAIGVCFSGDFITMLIYLEIMAITSTVVIFSSRQEYAGNAGMRYAIMHFLSGVLLMSGVVGYISMSGTVELAPLNGDMEILFPVFALDMNGAVTWLILMALLINIAVPPFSAWLPDAYPKASPGGAVFLSAFTTKTSVFLLLTLFAGTKLLVFIGIFMAVYGIIYAILENDMRRILSYSIITQVGFMVVGIGVGTEDALNGVALLAFAHIIYKALLFMVAGSVLQMTGRSKIIQLGGLVFSMRVTFACSLIGLVAMAAFPFTGSFLGKSLIFHSSMEEGLTGLWFVLLAASAGVMLCSAILKMPWLPFLQKDSGLRPEDPPVNMCIAMGLLAFLCVVIGMPGIAGKVLYPMLPYPVEYNAYGADHIISQLQLLLFSLPVFYIMLPFLKRTPTISLDFDWFYRGLGRYVVLAPIMIAQVPLQFFRILLKKLYRSMFSVVENIYGPGGIMARRWAIGSTAMWVLVVLGVYLVVCYIQ